MSGLLEQVLRHPEIAARPPVLVDLGAAGGLPPRWKRIAPHAVCLAFDADTREFSASESAGGPWKRLYSVNRLVAETSRSEVPFHLTRAPQCSSVLPPDGAALASWAFGPLFEVERVVRLPAIGIAEALSEAGVDRIDWYKSDTQGTDLRIFGAIPAAIRERILVAEFEPGILDAYAGEDKLHALMARMDALPFWVSAMELRGSQRIDAEDFRTLAPLQRKAARAVLPTSPGWCEIAYLNDFSGAGMGCREFLLGWVFATLHGQHGFALGLARRGAERFAEPLFARMRAHSRGRIDRRWPALLTYAARRVLGRLARRP